MSTENTNEVPTLINIPTLSRVNSTISNLKCRMENLLESLLHNDLSDEERTLKHTRYIKCIEDLDVCHQTRELLMDSYNPLAISYASLSADDGADEALRTFNATKEFLNIRMANEEYIDAYTGRFQRLRIDSRFADDRLAAHLYANSLTPFMSSQILLMFANSIESMTNVESVAIKARILQSHLHINPNFSLIGGDANDPNERSSLSDNSRETSVVGSTIGSNTDFVDGPADIPTDPNSDDAPRHTSRNRDKTCEIHGANSSHNSNECRIIKTFALAMGTVKRTNRTTNDIQKSRTCVRCRGKYFRGHNEVCSARRRPQ